MKNLKSIIADCRLQIANSINQKFNKSLILFIAVFFFSITAQGQITLEKSYNPFNVGLLYQYST